MLTHYSTLQALAHGFHEKLRHATIQEIFTQQRNELLISCRSETGVWTLCISCDPKPNYIFLRDSVARAKRNSVDLFDSALSQRIVGISVHPHDRILQIELENKSSLLFQAFGTMANVLLIDGASTIIDSFKRKRDFAGKLFEVQLRENPLSALANAQTLEEALRQEGSRSIFAALKAVVPGLGSTLAREVLHRSRIEEKLPVKSLSTEDIEEIEQRAQQVFTELASPRPTLYYRGNIPRVFSLIPLQHFTGSRAESFSSVNDAVRNFVVQTFRIQAIDAEKNLVLSKIKNAIDRSQRSLAAIKEELQHASRADEYERIAKIIMANLQHLTKGTKVIDLPDLFSRDKLTRIVLDPKLVPAQNAERYFDKAKKARHAYEETEDRAEVVKKDLALLEKLQLHLDSCLTKEQLEEFRNEYKTDLLRLKLLKPSGKGEEIPFRTFAVTGGFEVWAGKSSENNDLLTTKYARPNDLWFHVRGGSGSHVVLKVGTGSGNPPKEAIEQAAAIAAYYSKMRNAKMVPVTYCERKYVKKPKGAPAGTVSLQHEKVLFAEPALPAAMEKID
jgi:predicted ribosome quality control (RQC) complex YloA/Tae2 family protein